MKPVYVLSIIISMLKCSLVYSQGIGMIKCYGAPVFSGVCTDGDDAMGVIKTLDNGFAFASSVNDSGGDIPSNNGICDFWIFKTDSNGVVQWKKSFGGTDWDLSYSLGQAADSSFYVVGYTMSNDGDMSCNIGSSKNFIIKLSAAGNLINSRCFGGFSGSEERPHLAITSDNGVIVNSTTGSNDGDVSGNHGTVYDIWVTKFDSSLNIQWQHCYGGTSVETSNDVINGFGGEFIVTGRARSVNGDLTFNRGIYDLWVIKIDSIGNIIWNQVLAGSDWDIPYSIYLDTDSSIYISGYSSSNDFDFTGNHGRKDAIVIKMNYSGSVIWKKCYGGSLDEQSSSITRDSDGNFLVLGYTSSNDQQVSGNNGINGSGWIFKIDTSGTLLWQKCYNNLWPNEFVRDHQSNAQFISPSFQPGCNSGNLSITELKPTNFLTGRVYVDYNSNLQIDAGEPLYQNAFIQAVSLFDSVNTFSNLNGNFWLYPDTGTYITSPPIGIPYYNYFPLQQSTSHNTTGNYDTLNFALTPIPGIHDLQITLLPAVHPIIGRWALYNLHYKNAGTDSASAIVYFKKDSLLNFVSANPAPTGIAGDSLYWNFNMLLPFQSGDIEITLSVPIPPIVSSGDTVQFTTGILQVTNDTVPGDNYDSLTQVVYGSYDPNDKIILGRDSVDVAGISNGEYITYIIRFQNTGTAAANNVVITDQLSSLFEMNTIEVVSASNPYEMFMENNLITWSFYNIQLPDSGHDQAGSHGYICFRVKISGSVTNPVDIGNNASIYFDYNPPVITNTAFVHIYHLINSITGINKSITFSLYPNPAHESLHVVSLDGDRIKNLRIYNSIGDFIFQSTSTSLDIRSLPQGLYFIKIESVRSGVSILKFLKE